VADRSYLLTFGGAVGLLALPDGVKMTALGLEEGAGSSRLWLGLPLLVAGVVGLECFRRAAELLRAEVRPPDPEAGRGLLRVSFLLQVVAVACLQLMVLLKFALLLDGHVHLRATCWLYLAYVVGAVPILAGRQARTEWGSRYLRCGWAVLMAFGVPLMLPFLKDAGLVPFSPLTW
jgi:hypothetical protein